MGHYIELHGERKRLENVIDRADKPYLIYGAKGLGKTQLVHSQKYYNMFRIYCIKKEK